VTLPNNGTYQEGGADLSPCGTYRYRLWRRWGTGCDVAFVMLNPSTADASVDDPTIRRCMGFARSWGFDGVEVVNLYAYRATKPKILVEARGAGIDVEGPGNAQAWRAAGLYPGQRTIVAAWGANCHLSGLPASRAFWDVCPTGYKCLGITKSGDPRHPLYVRADAPLVAFTGREDA
jgi:hypothetical protein